MLEVGIVVLRVVLGAFVAAHGVQKLTHLWGGGGLAASAEEFREDGFVGGTLTALAAGGSQIIGGALLILGLFTPLASVMVIATMLVAVTVKIPVGFWSQDGGYEYPLFLAALGVAVAFTGPGAVSAEHLFGLSDLYQSATTGWWVSLATAIAGVLGGPGARLALHRGGSDVSGGRN